MSELTGAALLRAAATRCRQLDQAATNAPWHRAADHSRTAHHLGGWVGPNSVGNWDGEYAHMVVSSYHGDGDQADRDARYTAAFRAVAAPLANWLDAAAEVAEANDAHDGFDLDTIDNISYRAACAVARAVLAGGQTG